MTKATYTALCERSGSWWSISVPEVHGVHTQAKRLDQADAMARDAIALMLEVPPDSFDIEVKPYVSPEADDAIRYYMKAREEVADAQRHLAAASTNAARSLVTGMGLTVRDAGRILGVSYQRIDQLLHRR